MKTREEREKEFLIGLEKLTRETGIIIGGCGCCGSPSLDEASDAELSDPDAGYGYGYAGEVSWISHADSYDWERFSDSIVRSNGEVRGASRLAGDASASTVVLCLGGKTENEHD